MKISHLTTAEEQLMMVLWDLESAYMREIIAQYPDPKPHPNTISTFLKILVEKEFLKTVKEGRVFRYSVAIPYHDYKKFLILNFLDTYFNHSALNLVNLLLTENLLKLSDFFEQTDPNHTKQSSEDDGNADQSLGEFIEEITTSSEKKKKNKKKKKKDKKNKDRK